MVPGLPTLKLTGYALAAALLAWACDSGGALAGANSALIIDGSNSMNSPFDGGSRIEALKAAVSRAVPEVADRLDLGLVVFGHRETQDCEDVETIVAPEAGSAAQVPAAVEGITARGVSAVAASIVTAARDVGYRDRAATIIAVADSAGVKNCLADTCATAKGLADEAADLRIHVIAVGAKQEEIPYLQCMATETGGEFMVASSRSTLAAAMTHMLSLAADQEQTTVEREIAPPRPKPARRIALAEIPPRPKPDNIAGARSLPEAEGLDETDAGDGSGATDNVTVFAPTRPGDGAPASEEPGAAEEPSPSPAAEIVIGPEGTSDEATRTTTLAPSHHDASEEAASRDVTASADTAMEPEADEAPDYGVSRSLPAPAATTILAKRPDDDSAPAAERAPTAVASTAPADEPDAPSPPAGSGDAGPGTARLTAYIIENTKPIGADVEWRVLETVDDGTERAVVASSSEPSPVLDLPEGDYFVRATFGHATRTAPLRVNAGEEATVDIVLDAGGLQIDPVNAGTEEPESAVLNAIYAAGTTTRPVAEDVPSGTVVYLNAGVYRIESRYGNANAVAVADIEVQPGKLVKARINHRAGPAAFRLVPEGSDEPLGDTEWQVMTTDGTLVSESSETTPRQVLAEGAYELVVRHGGKTYRSSFEIRPGEETDVEVVAR